MDIIEKTARELPLQCRKQQLDNVEASINLANWTTVRPNQSLDLSKQRTYTTETAVKNTDTTLLCFAEFVLQSVYPFPWG